MSRRGRNSARVITLGARLAFAVMAIVAIACGDGGSPTEPGDPPLDQTAKVGVVGCSQTSSSWRGWTETGDSRVWTSVSAYGGGAVTDWARGIPNGDYWRRFEDNRAANPPANIIWFQLCDRNFRTGNVMLADAVVEEIRRRIPGVTIYVTPLAEFERPETCAKQNIGNSRVMTDYLVSTGAALRGPDLPMVLDNWIQPPEGDGRCHVGPTGRAAFGMTLAGFDWRVR